MNCPTCHARLLPVKGQLFCLQCGEIVPESAAEPEHQHPAPKPVAQMAPRQPVTPRMDPVAPPPSRPASVVPAPASASATASSAAAPTAVRTPAPVAPPAAAMKAPPTTSLVGAAVTKAQPVALPLGVKGSAVVSGWHRRYLPWPLIGTLVLVAVLAVADALVRSYYQDRVYPGVKVANQSLGGRPLSAVSGVVKNAVPADTVKFTIGTSEYVMKPSELGGTTNAGALEEQVREAGRSHPFALAGAIETLLSKPLQPVYQVNERVLRAAAERMATEHSHPAVDAHPLIVGTTPVVIAEKAGQQVDRTKLYDGLLIALQRHEKVTISATKLTPTIAAASYAADVEDAQAKIGLSMSIKIRNTRIAPAAMDVADWLRFGAPGSGARIDEGHVAAFVAGIGGRFDRPATQAAILGALRSKQPLDYTASIRRNVPANPAAIVPPVTKTYSFCTVVREVPVSNVAALTTKAQSTLDNPQGWALGGRLKFLPASSNCNMAIWLVPPGLMSSFAPACANQSSCQTDNNVVINASNWSKPPASWKGSLEDYRAELINHEIGHWLGFDHDKCNAASPVAAPVNQQTLKISGCSPLWYAIPVELQGRKVLPGF